MEENFLEKFLEKFPKAIIVIFALFLFLLIGLSCVRLSLFLGNNDIVNDIVIFFLGLFFIWLIILPIKLLLYAIWHGSRPVTYITRKEEQLSQYMHNNDAKTNLNNKNKVMSIETYSKTQFISKYYIKCIDKKTKHFFVLSVKKTLLQLFGFFKLRIQRNIYI